MMPDQRNTSLTNPQQVRRTVTTVVLLVALLALIAWLLYVLRAVLLLLTFTAIFCYLIAPLVDVVQRLGTSKPRIPRILAVSTVYLLLAVVIAFALDYAAPKLSEQLSAFWENVPAYVRQLDQSVKSLEALPNRYRLPLGWRQPLSDWVGSMRTGAIEWLQMLVGRTLWLARFLPWLILIPVIGFFFLKDAKQLSEKFLLTLPQVDMRYRLAIFLKDVSETLAAYIRAQLIACFLVGFIEGTGLWLLGLRYPLLFGVAAAFFEFVPVVGPLVLGVTAVFVAGFHSWQSMLIVAGFLAGFRLIHDYIIYPRLLSEEVEIHPVLVILAVLSGAELGGVIGIFLSVPTVALLIVCWRHWRDLQLDRANPILAPDGKQMTESLLVEE